MPMDVSIYAASSTTRLPSIGVSSSTREMLDRRRRDREALEKHRVELEADENYSTHFDAECVRYDKKLKPYVTRTVDPKEVRVGGGGKWDLMNIVGNDKNTRKEKTKRTVGFSKSLPALPTAIQADKLLSKRRDASMEKRSEKPAPKMFPEMLSVGFKNLDDMSPSQSNDKNIYKGLRDFNNGEYSVAIVRLLKASRAHPSSPLVNFLLGLAYAKLTNFKVARKHFHICCKLEAEGFTALAFYNKGLANCNLSLYKNGIEDLTKAISLRKELDFFKTRALVYRRRGEYKKAQQDYIAIQLLEAQREQKSLLRGEGAREGSVFSLSSSSPGRKVSPTKIAQKQAMEASKAKREKSQEALKQKIYGMVHVALMTPPAERTDKQLDILVKETKTMTAFKHINEHQLRELWKHFVYKKYTTNVRIFEKGDEAEIFYVILTGSVSARIPKQTERDIEGPTATATATARTRQPSIALLAEDDETTINVMHAGETLGEAVGANDVSAQVRKASCVTEEHSELLLLDQKGFDQTFRKFFQKRDLEKILLLKENFACFREWPTGDLSKIATFCREHTFPPGSTIIKQGARADALFFVEHGLVKVVRSIHMVEAGNNVNICDVLVTKLCSNEIFGEEIILKENNSEHKSSIISDTRVKCLRIDVAQIDNKLWAKNNSAAAIKKMAVNYPDDCILLQFHLDKVRKLKNLGINPLGGDPKVD